MTVVRIVAQGWLKPPRWWKQPRMMKQTAIGPESLRQMPMMFLFWHSRWWRHPEIGLRARRTNKGSAGTRATRCSNLSLRLLKQLALEENANKPEWRGDGDSISADSRPPQRQAGSLLLLSPFAFKVNPREVCLSGTVLCFSPAITPRQVQVLVFFCPSQPRCRWKAPRSEAKQSSLGDCVFFFFCTLTWQQYDRAPGEDVRLIFRNTN